MYARELIPGELARSELIEVFVGVRLPVVSRFDAAVSKLVWVKKGSLKSRRDLRFIFRQASAEEQQAILSWAEQQGLEQLVGSVLAEVDELE